VHNYEQHLLILTNYKLSKMSFRIAFFSRQSYCNYIYTNNYRLISLV